MATIPGHENKDPGQTLKESYDPDLNRLRVDALVTDGVDALIINPDGSVNVNITGGALDFNASAADGDNIAISDGTNTASVDPNGGLNVNILDGSITAELTPSGLKEALKTTSLIITDTPQAVPNTPLVNRNTMTVRVWGSNVVYFGDSTVSVAQGYPKMRDEEIFLDIRDNPSVELYAVCATGQTCEIRILEIA